MKGRDSKVVVFSQFVSALELAQRALKTSGLACVAPALLPVEVRPAAVSAFVNEPAVGVCLLTLDHAQSAGLTLTVASTVVLLDPVLDTSIEDQAIARVHRIGQSVPVTAIRLCQGWCPASSDDPSLRWRGLDVIDATPAQAIRLTRRSSRSKPPAAAPSARRAPYRLPDKSASPSWSSCSPSKRSRSRPPPQVPPRAPTRAPQV